jgi:hypothetical protein
MGEEIYRRSIYRSSNRLYTGERNRQAWQKNRPARGQEFSPFAETPEWHLAAP